MAGRAGRFRSRDCRATVLALVLAGIVAGGVGLQRLPGGAEPPAAASARIDPWTDGAGHAAQARKQEIRTRFDQAVIMLHARRYEHAATALHRVLALDPTLPEAHANMGYAMLGLERYPEARDFFLGAIELRPGQVNAYYGLAVALEELNDLAGALGAMRTYVHLAAPEDPYRRKGEAAIWEWEAKQLSQNREKFPKTGMRAVFGGTMIPSKSVSEAGSPQDGGAP